MPNLPCVPLSIDTDTGWDEVAARLRAVPLPRMALVERTLASLPPIDDVAVAVDAALANIALPRGSIAVGVGSRGVGRIDDVVRALVARLVAAGARPFVVPAMGAHGASTAAGQIDVLAHLGVTEAAVGAPIRATMDTVVVGSTPDGVPVHVDAYALAADAICVVNRVKPHTSFRGEIESGPTKMLAIGLGKQVGAREIHARGWDAMHRTVPAAARVVLATGKVAFAVAILESHGVPARIVAFAPDDLIDGEAALLVEAKRLLPTLPFSDIDVLVVDRVGKTVSGAGADPNVTGRWPTTAASGGPRVTRLAYLDLADGGAGNGNGIGLADVITQRLARRWSAAATYLNALTTTAAGNARLPMIVPTADDAVAAALLMCPNLDPRAARVVRILDTAHVERMWVSQPALEALRGDPRVRVLREASDFTFDTFR